jgi:Ca2+:H+ antiporter
MRPPKLANAVNDLSLTWRMSWPDYGERRQEGTALATIDLTIPAVLTIGLITGYEVHLGLGEVQTVLLILTLFVSALTFGGARTNVLRGIVHLLLFIVYFALIFSP